LTEVELLISALDKSELEYVLNRRIEALEEMQRIKRMKRSVPIL